MSATLARSFESPDSAIDVAKIRDEFAAAVAEDGRPLPQIAKEIQGYAYQTIYSWAKGDYSGKNEEVAKAAQSWLLTRAAREEVQATMPAEPPFVLTRTAERIHRTLEHAQLMPDMVEITGAPGIGKTVALRAYCQKMSNAWMITGEPVIDSMTFLLATIADAVGIASTGTKAGLHTRLNRRFNASRGLLIIDQTEYLHEEFLDQIRMFHDSAKIGIAFVGTEAVSRKLGLDGGTSRLSQLHRRVGLRLNRKTPAAEDVGTILNAWSITEEPQRKYLLGVSQKPGALGKMTKVLRMAAALARQDGVPQPSIEHLTMAATRLGVGGAG